MSVGDALFKTENESFKWEELNLSVSKLNLLLFFGGTQSKLLNAVARRHQSWSTDSICRQIK